MCELLLCLRSGLRRERLGFAGGQLQRKCRSVPRFAVHGNGAVMFLNDRARDRKAEACAAMFGGKERREDLGEMLSRNPNTGVPNLDADNLAPITLGRFCGYGERPAAGHGLNAVEQDIQERLLHLPRISGDVGQIGGKPFLYFDMKLLCVWPHERERRADESVNVARRHLLITEPRKLAKIVE